MSAKDQSPASPAPLSADAPLPVSAEEAEQAAAALGLTIPEACMPGVLANLALLARHAATLCGEDAT